MSAEWTPPPADRRTQSDSDGERRPSAIPFLRTWKIAARALHLLVTYLLVAAHLAGAARPSIEPLLWVAIVSGAAMAFLEVFPNLQLLVQGWAMLVVVKLALLALVPFFWERRIELLMAVIVIAAIGSHLPARYRHYSIWHGRVIKPI